MEIKKDYYPVQLAEILCADAGRTDAGSLDSVEQFFYHFMAVAENEHNSDYFLTAWEMMQEAAEKRERARLRDKELDYISRGLVSLIRDASDAKKLVLDRKAQAAIDNYIRELQALNTKICMIEGGKE